MASIVLPEVNILLVGESGVGKRTTLNAIPNYQKYASFNDANASPLFQLTPTLNEVSPDQQAGEHSIEKSPSSYVFRFGRTKVRMIDNPSFGDNAAKEPNLNFNSAMPYLLQHRTLHSICVLLKSTDKCLSVSFRFYFAQLLATFHKNSMKNIIFLFTFSRQSSFGAGEAFITLKQFLEKHYPQLDIQLIVGVNCFFIDNEAYRYLVAKRQSDIENNKHESVYSDSWENSAQQIEQMLECISDMEPHLVKETISVKETQQWIIAMDKMKTFLKEEMANFQDKWTLKRNEFAQKMRRAENDFFGPYSIYVASGNPSNGPVFCASANRSKCSNGNTEKKTHCRSLKSLTCFNIPFGLDFSESGWQSSLQQWMYCADCSCPIYDHACFGLKEDDFPDWKIQGEVFTKKKELFRQCADFFAVPFEVASEYTAIEALSAQLASLLSANSILPFNALSDPYLNLIIALNDYLPSNLDSLLALKKNNEEELHILREAFEENTNEEMGDIEYRLAQIYQELLHLKYSRSLVQNMTANISAKKSKNLSDICEQSALLYPRKESMPALSF